MRADAEGQLREGPVHIVGPRLKISMYWLSSAFSFPASPSLSLSLFHSPRPLAHAFSRIDAARIHAQL